MTDRTFLSLSASATLPLLRDGAMGTMLYSRGVNFDECFDALNLTRPALVADIHRAYIEAGAQIIQTNTFGANRYKLAEHDLADQVAEINRAGVELARRVVLGAFREVLIAGNVGPLGVPLAPFGRVQREQARAAFAEQIRALVEAGVALLSLETFTDLHEIREAIAAAKAESDLPVVATMTFTRDDRTLLGDSPEKVARGLVESGADVIGVNCAGGPAQIMRLIRRMMAAEPEARFAAVPNAGWPEQTGGRIMYPATPDYFAEYARAFRQIGVTLIGGCCGTTPQHVAAMREALDAPAEPEIELPLLREAQVEPLAAPEACPTELAQKLEAGHFVVSVEMDPPRTISSHKLLAGASLFAEVGADVINVADSPMARMRMSPWAVCHLIQDQIGIETVLHFPTRGRNLLRVQGDLLAAHTLGIRNIFVVMGDPTAIGDYPDAMDDYDLTSSGLIKLIKQELNAGVDHAGSDIGQPTAFVVGGALNLMSQRPEQEMRVMQRKIDAGVDFFLTQPLYQPEAGRAFVSRYEEEYGPLDVPILVGVMPLYGVRNARFLHNELPGITISSEIFDRLERAGDDAPHEGVQIAIETVEAVRSWAAGIYLMPTFNRYDLAAEIIEAAQAPDRLPAAASEMDDCYP
jgi:homocysteine S-methyltransferase